MDATKDNINTKKNTKFRIIRLRLKEFEIGRGKLEC